MTDDLLEKATRAYRAETEPPRDPELETLERVLARRAAAPKRSPARLVTVPLIAATLVVGAWAGATGRLTALLGITPSPVESHQAPASSIAGGSTARPSRAVPEAPREESAPSAESPSVAVPPIAPHPIVTPRAPARIATPTSSVPAARPSPMGPSAPPAVSEDELYRAAHRAHFVDKDYGTALAAWDRYLASSPSGTFVVEARYNRALCLVRLGRSAAAREALTPFAEGDYGTYRKAEAKALLESLAP